MNQFLRKFMILICACVSSPCSYALSCIPLNDRIFVQCANGVCNKAFRAQDIPVWGMCSRRVVVEDIPEALAQSLGTVVSGAVKDKEAHLYQVLASHSYGATPMLAADLVRDLGGKPSARTRLKRIDAVPSDTNFESLKGTWLERADLESKQTRLYSLVDCGALIIGLIALTFTQYQFRRAMGLFRSEKRPRAGIWKILIAQAALLGIGLMPWITFVGGAAAIRFLAPLVVLVLLYEAAVYVYSLSKRQPRT